MLAIQSAVSDTDTKQSSDSRVGLRKPASPLVLDTRRVQTPDLHPIVGLTAHRTSS